MIWLGFGFILGIVLGSFIKVIADRSLTQKPITGRSYCLHCKHNLKWYDLFPVMSFISLRGKCRYCSNPIPISNLIVEIIFGVLIAFLFWQSSSSFLGFSNTYELILFSMDLLFKIFILAVLVIVAITDFKETIIPDKVTYPGVVIGLAGLFIITASKIAIFYKDLSVNVIGKYLLPPNSDYFSRHSYIIAQPLLSGLIMAVVIGLFFFILILITRGRGMGGGDLKLGVFLGLVFGFPNSLLVIVLAFLSGSVIALILILLKRKNFGQTIPFGPFLSLGGIITLFWSPPLLALLRWS